jgi:cysteine desulfurase
MAPINKIYLDNNSTTEVSETASGYILDLLLKFSCGNSSSNHEFGKRTKALIEGSRSVVADSIGAPTNSIIFTSGGTESNNLAIRGIFNPYSGGKIVLSNAEHSSVFNTAFDVAPDSLDYIPLTKLGHLDLEEAKEKIKEGVSLVCVMLANNEIGTVFQIKQIVELAHKVGAVVFCDAVQAYGKIDIDINELGVDLLSISGHKAHALPGIGALYIRPGLYIKPLMTGGEQESGIRAGTENYVGIVSLASAAEEITNGSLVEPDLRDAFEAALKRRFPGITIHGELVERVPNTSTITFKGIRSDTLLSVLDYNGVAASAGSACSANSVKPMKTILAMGFDEEEALSTVRFSFSKLTTIPETAQAINAVVKSVESITNTTH